MPSAGGDGILFAKVLHLCQLREILKGKEEERGGEGRGGEETTVNRRTEVKSPWVLALYKETDA